VLLLVTAAITPACSDPQTAASDGSISPDRGRTPVGEDAGTAVAGDSGGLPSASWGEDAIF
jgi:hypothetical protein